MVPGNASEIERGIVEWLAVPLEEYRRRHEAQLAEITSRAIRSPVYSGRIREVSSFDDLRALPLTSYEQIYERTKQDGLDQVLLAPVKQSFHTSGSTGEPKRFHYGEEDITRIVFEYAMVSHIMGIRPEQKGWNLGGPLPDVSGYFLTEVGTFTHMQGSFSTLLKDDKDLIKALRRACQEENIEIMAAPALILYLIGRMANEPGFLYGLVEDKAMRSYHLPRPLARLIRRLYLHGIDVETLKRITKGVTVATSYAEALNPYMGELSKCYPRLQIFDIYGSTENPIMGVQLDPSVNGLCMIINTIIPEIAPAEEVLKAKEDPHHPIKSAMWYEWRPGMVGELIITRPGQCLPLVRYPTGDVVQVLEPAHTVPIKVNGTALMLKLPLIRILGRSMETMDFEAQDESGNYLGMKIYSRYVNEALHRSSNVRWWELYNIRGSPNRLVIVVVPENDPSDKKRFAHEVVRRLTEERSDIPHSFQTANDLGRLEVIVLPSSAYNSIQMEIDRRIREGRSYGQLKPKHIYTMAGDAEFESLMRAKFSEHYPAAASK